MADALIRSQTEKERVSALAEPILEWAKQHDVKLATEDWHAVYETASDTEKHVARRLDVEIAQGAERSGSVRGEAVRPDNPKPVQEPGQPRHPRHEQVRRDVRIEPALLDLIEGPQMEPTVGDRHCQPREASPRT